MQIHSLTVATSSSKRVEEIEIRPVMENSTGVLNITDMMLQGGTVATVWTGHPAEIKWSFDS